MSMIINPYRFGAAGDPHWANVVYLALFEGSNGSTTIIDSSSSAHAITAAGDAKLVTYVKKFGVSSLFFDGWQDWIWSPNSPDFQLGAGDFTLEFWYQPSGSGGISGVKQIINSASAPNTNNSYAISTNGTSLLYYLSSTGSTWDIANGVSIGTVATNNRYHIALVRDGNTFRPFLNGTQGTTTVSSASLFANTGDFRWGMYNNSGYVVGYFDSIRLTKNVARYTANFTPPSEDFPDF